MTKHSQKYKQTQDWKKWLLQFVLNWIFWAVVYGLFYWIVPAEHISTSKFLFMISFMALFWTLVFDMLLSPWLRGKFGNHSK